ncbi:C45 family peptidase tan [Arctopsyche grandis]|uniref:C45 family peptidase tan n=1 Tax=Arctopsyche grandis TaxID=121162 RepID=UPI00406D6DD4
MPATDNIGRRHCIPVIYAKGTHYEVGFDVGRTFSSIIQNLVRTSGPLNDEYLPTYATADGKRIYEETLANVKANFPQYVTEVEGTADGAGVPFHKLFLLQMDDITTNVANQSTVNNKPVGCSSICLNELGNEILGHTEDALSEVLNHYYILSAHIVSDKPMGKWKVKEERFTSLCYAGHLPGYTMGFNHHGLVYSINTLSARYLRSGKTPRTFLTRALLSAENQVMVEQILSDDGSGSADGCSVNMTFLGQEGDRLFSNIEMGPATESQNRSQLNVFTASPGEYIIHCNRYLRLKIPEVTGLIIDSSEERLDVLKKYGHPINKKGVIEMLSDQTGKNYRVFQESGPEDYVKTIAVGIFDCSNYTWSLYADKPSCHEPLIVMPLLMSSSKQILS